MLVLPLLMSSLTTHSFPLKMRTPGLIIEADLFILLSIQLILSPRSIPVEYDVDNASILNFQEFKVAIKLALQVKLKSKQ